MSPESCSQSCIHEPKQTVLNSGTWTQHHIPEDVSHTFIHEAVSWSSCCGRQDARGRQQGETISGWSGWASLETTHKQKEEERYFVFKNAGLNFEVSFYDVWLLNKTTGRPSSKPCTLPCRGSAPIAGQLWQDRRQRNKQLDFIFTSHRCQHGLRKGNYTPSVTHLSTTILSDLFG